MDSTNNPSFKKNVGIYIYPDMTMLDAYGPLQVLAVSGLVNVFTFSQELEPIPSDANVNLLPNYGFIDCPEIDVLIVPGSANPIAQIRNKDVIDFLRKVGNNADYVTSVCTGALILAETGLLDGYKTTLHWAYTEALKKYPKVQYVNRRVVRDRNRISGGGITSGLDFALELLSELSGGPKISQNLELLMEYDPQPPFKTGNHNTVDKELKQSVQILVDTIASDLF
ncbi:MULTISPECIES: DJ-1/PfpI family protein [Gammaproteobacteria]|jgi:transcriptional regulator GlxA family with amidase domain|uniref:DJ-1/PfpI family protein n=1 Tax=Gammaproteobacteria TaxID=1236 RepID=UPI00104FB6C5|nr:MULTISPECIES: DJ-1/PfpI family protein [Gammaproteobacteria]MCZ4338166.1 DJ-1/PfpI family protein [Shewanella colwelliana]TCV20955.1 transcriptional regulator GlxA family with amidase domain [Vibrio crassostreae]